MKYRYLLTLLAIFLLTGCSKKPTNVPTLPTQTEMEEVYEVTIDTESEELEIETEQTEEIATEIIQEIQEETTTTINATEKEIAVFNLVNEEREKNGLASLEWDFALYDTAKIRAEEASKHWSHTRPDGTHWSVLSDELHGENLAKGYYNSEEAFQAWMESEGHRENILRSEFTRGAVYFHEAENGWFWCQHFGY